MSRARPAAGAFWPTPTQRLLLRTALREGEPAAEAWRRARPSLDLDVMEPGSIVLTPLIYHKLVALGIDDPDLQRLKGLYRRAWYENQLLVEQLDRQLSALAEAGIETLVPGGLPLVQRFYGDIGLRRVASIDLLVREADAEAAAGTLRDLGMIEQPGSGNADAPRSFRSDRGHVCFLHARPPRDLLAADDGRAGDLWGTAIEVGVGASRCLALAPTEELLVSCLTGAKPAAERRIDWVLDSATIIASAAAEIDWGRLREEAAARRLTLRLRDALGFLRRELDVAVPEDALAARERPAPAEALAHRLAAGRRGVLGGFPDTLATHLRLQADRGLARALLGLPAFLERTWGVEHAWQLVPRAGAKLARGTAATGGRALRRRQRHPGRRQAPGRESAPPGVDAGVPPAEREATRV